MQTLISIEGELLPHFVKLLGFPREHEFEGSLLVFVEEVLLVKEGLLLNGIRAEPLSHIFNLEQFVLLVEQLALSLHIELLKVASELQQFCECRLLVQVVLDVV